MKKAFTVAELIITLSIIGVVTTMTLPALLNAIAISKACKNSGLTKEQCQWKMEATRKQAEIDKISEKENFIKSLEREFTPQYTLE